MEIGAALLIAIVGAGIGAAIGVFVLRLYQNQQAQNWRVQAEQESREKIEDATNRASTITKEAEDKGREITEEMDRVASRRRRELDNEDERLQRRRESLDDRVEKLEQREQNLNKRQSRLDKQQNDLQEMEALRTAELQRIAQMTIEEAKTELMAAAEQDARNDMARIIRQVEADAREEADTRARNVISLAVQPPWEARRRIHRTRW
jgi:ribonuclease Y